MLGDMFEIITSYSKSRAKRIFSLIENAAEESAKAEMNISFGTAEEKERRDYLLNLSNLKEALFVFKKNYLEDLYKPHSENSWTKILDENYGDTIEASNKLLDKSCFK